MSLKQPVCAGYPVDVPAKGGSIRSYAVLSYHLPLMIGFSISQRTSFVWGGCMLFPRQAMVDDVYGIMQVCSLPLHAVPQGCNAC